MKNLHELEVNRPRTLAYRVIVAQLALTGLIALLLWVFMGQVAAFSALVAGVICAVANWFFAWRVFRHWGAQAAKRFVAAFCLGEIVKLIMLGVFFVLAVVFLRIEIKPFLISFIINLMIYWFAPFIIFGLEKR